MVVLQSSYAETMAKGVPGMIANSEGMANRITRTAAGNIGFGQPVVRVANHKCAEMSAETLAAVAAAVAGNTGNGAMGAVTVSAGAKEGVYKLSIIAAAANAGTFELEDPDGVPVDIGTVAVAFSSGGIAFTLADGATDFVVGDQFTITVAPTGGTNVLDFLGIAIMDKTLVHTTPDRYEALDSVAILPGFTPICVTCGATVAEGDNVYWNASAKKFTNTVTDIPIREGGTGQFWKFDEAGVDTDIVWISRR